MPVAVQDKQTLKGANTVRANRLSKVGERGQIVIPKPIRDELGIGLNTSMEFELRGREIVMRPAKDMEAYRRNLEKWTGFLAGHLERDGYASVQEFMDDIRDRDAEYKRIMEWDRDDSR